MRPVKHSGRAMNRASARTIGDRDDGGGRRGAPAIVRCDAGATTGATLGAMTRAMTVRRWCDDGRDAGAMPGAMPGAT